MYFELAFIPLERSWDDNCRNFLSEFIFQRKFSAQSKPTIFSWSFDYCSFFSWNLFILKLILQQLTKCDINIDFCERFSIYFFSLKFMVLPYIQCMLFLILHLFLAHLAKAMWAFAITCRPSYVVNFHI
jgi:hypothetical protein